MFFLSDSFLLFTLYIYCVGDVIRFRQAFQRETIGGLGPGWLQYATTIPVEKNGKTKDNCQRIEKCSFLFTVTDELVRFFGPPKKAIVIQSRDTTVSRKKKLLRLKRSLSIHHWRIPLPSWTNRPTWNFRTNPKTIQLILFPSNGDMEENGWHILLGLVN